MSELESLSTLYRDACVTYATLSISYFALSRNSAFSYNGDVWKRILFGLTSGLVSLYLNQDQWVISGTFFYSFELIPIILVTFYGGWLSGLTALLINFAFTGWLTLDNILITIIFIPLILSRVWEKKSNRIFYTTIFAIAIYRIVAALFVVPHTLSWAPIVVYQLISALCLAICYHALNFKERHIYAYFSMKNRVNIDKLTQLNNRSSIDYRLTAIHNSRQACGLLILDLDHFKSVNDTYGHNGGDLLLTEVGKLLTSSIRDEDFVGRYGGEEFIVITRRHEPQTIKAVAERIRQQVENLAVVLPDGRKIKATISIGASLYLPGMSMLKALKMTDEALYQAKKQGRNQVVYSRLMPFSPLGDNINKEKRRRKS
ncbi:MULTISPECIES: GGDEF domain-containing protein [Yersinia]|jgi:diguanylate cyclase|uniref:diguanylate cyclase n=1 Tax=Yersinia intermedia TaxID=631 RepID=A0ABX6FC08_YERIN|nr:MULTISPECIES: GGDEF domain-containing protein [Yersinia]AJJ18020.1 diguanylate cyclase domain protein [Yersinia intermedia]ARB85280.1 GGDEF domain-containing protein [Yersinia sp. FDAARGOS_228]AVL35094.1 GGDEF domain-containing protein [Yersinia intermedia]MCB5296412.1 GGDEF domain-containing protein [Yersinia intermedia]MDA5514578.1 GGDEF domain-containing protein [Yersinia intermedia]